MIKLGKINTETALKIVKIFKFNMEVLSWSEVPTAVEFYEEKGPIRICWYNMTGMFDAVPTSLPVFSVHNHGFCGGSNTFSREKHLCLSRSSCSCRVKRDKNEN